MTLLVRSSLNVWDYYWLEDELIRLIVHFLVRTLLWMNLIKTHFAKSRKRCCTTKTNEPFFNKPVIFHRVKTIKQRGRRRNEFRCFLLLHRNIQRRFDEFFYEFFLITLLSYWYVLTEEWVTEAVVSHVFLTSYRPLYVQCVGGTQYK